MTPATPLIKEKKTKVFPIFVLVTLAFEGLILLVIIVQFILMGALAKRPIPSLVEKSDGTAIRVEPSDPLERKPETIRRFVGDAMTLMFDWSGKLPPKTIAEAKNPKPDPGVSVRLENGSLERVTSATWKAGFALSEEFRHKFLQKVSTLTPDEVFSPEGGSQALLVLRRVGIPEPIEDEKGQWKVPLIANLIIFSSQDQIGQSVSFNKEIFVQAVEPQKLPLEEQSGPLAQVVADMRHSGLEIYKIRDLDLGNQ